MKSLRIGIERNILKYTVTTSIWTHFLFSSLIVLSLEVIYLIVGWLIAVPTDYGRLFAFSLSSLTVSAYIYSFVFFILLKLLSLIWKNRLMTEIVLQRLLKHNQVSEKQVSPNEAYELIKDVLSIQGYKKRKLTVFVLLVLVVLYVLGCLFLPFTIFFFRLRHGM